MAHCFVIMTDGQLKTYQRFEDIPEEFDYLIQFVPEIPPGPHTHEQHEEIDSWLDKFKQLMERAKCVQRQD